MKSTPKRLFRSLVAIVLAVLMLPPLPWPFAVNAADLLVAYEPTQVGVAVVPGYIASDKQLRNSYVISDETMLVTEHFTKSGEHNLYSNYSNYDTLNSLLSFKHVDNDSWYVKYRWNITRGSALEELMRDKQISVGLQADLTADKHTNVKHVKKITDRAQAYVTVSTSDFSDRSSQTKKTASIINGDDDGDEVARTHYGSGSIGINMSGTYNLLVDYRDRVNYLEFYAGSTDCACGSSRVASPYIFLVDSTQPKIKAVYPSNENGDIFGYHMNKYNLEFEGEHLYVGANGEGYLAIEFTEYVRLADNKAHDLQLELSLTNAETNLPEPNKTITATLSKVTDTKLVFSFKAPAEGRYIIDSVNLEKAFYTHNGEEVNWLKAGDIFDLALMNGSGESVAVSGIQISSMVTDLAGNALDCDTSETLYMSNRIYTDTTAPQAVSQTVGGSMISSNTDYSAETWPADIDRSSVFAAVGDKVSFQVVLDDEVGSAVLVKGTNNTYTNNTMMYEKLFYADSRQNYDETNQELTSVGTSYDDYNPFSAKTNILDKDGNYVWVSGGWSTYCAAPSVDSPDVYTYLSFVSKEIEEGYHTANGEPVQITQIRFENHQVADACGNLLGSDGMTLDVNVIPDRKIYLDVTAPTITFESSQQDADSDGNVLVATPFTVTDLASGTEELASGVMGVEGSISPKLSMNYEYAITDSIDSKAVTTWNAEPENGTIKFTVLDGTKQYLHLKLIGDYYVSPQDGMLKYVQLSAQVTDYGGMTGSVVHDLGKIKADFTSPVFTFRDIAFALGNELISTVTVSDNSNLQSVSYYWTWDGNSTTPVTVDNIGKTSYKLEARNGPSSGAGTAQLTVTAVDVAGNSYTESKEYDYDLNAKKPKYLVGNAPGVISTSLNLALSRPEAQNDAAFVTVVYITAGETTYEFQLSSSDAADIDNLFSGQQYCQKYAAGEITFDEENQVITSTKSSKVTGSLDDALSSYNGTVTVRLINIAKSEIPSASGKYTFQCNQGTTSEILKEEMLLCTSSSANVSFDTANIRNGNGEVETNYGYPANTSTPTLRTLTGLSIPIQIDASGSPFGLDVVDFESSYAVLVDANGAELEDTKMELLPTDRQTFVISKPLSGHTARYQVKVVLNYLYGTWTTTEKTLDLFMDDTPYSDFYPTAYSHQFLLGTQTQNGTEKPVFTQALSADTVQLDVSTSEYDDDREYHITYSRKLATTLSFKTSRDDASLDAFPELKGVNLALKVYNSADPNGADKAVYANTKVFDVVCVDAFPDTYAANTVYILKDDSVAQEIVYSAQMRNGSTTSERSLKLNVSSDSIDFHVEHSAQDGTIATAQGKLVADNAYTQKLLDTNEYTLYYVYSLDSSDYYTTNYYMQELTTGVADTWNLSSLQTDGGDWYTDWYVGYFLIDKKFNAASFDLPEKVDDPLYFDYWEPYGNSLALNDVNSRMDAYYYNPDGQLKLDAWPSDPFGFIDRNSLVLSLYNKDADGNPINGVTWDVPVGTETVLTFPDEPETSSRSIPWADFVEGMGIYRTEVYNDKQRSEEPFGFNVGNKVEIYVQLPPELMNGQEVYASLQLKDTLGRSPTWEYETAVGAYNQVEGQNVMTYVETYRGELTLEGDYVPDFRSTYPSKIIAPERLAEEDYSLLHSIPIYDETPVEVTYQDIFGGVYTDTIQTEARIYSAFMVSVIENGENQPVTVKAWKTAESTSSYRLYSIDVYNEAGEMIDQVVSADHETATIDVYENGYVVINTNYSGGDFPIPITASAKADTAVEPVTIVWYDSEGEPIDVSTDTADRENYVTAQLVCDEELVGTTTGLSHVFRAPATAGTQVTLSYTDLAGNPGSTTVTLPFNVVASEEPPVDNTAPVYTARAYAMRSLDYKQYGQTYESDQAQESALSISKLPDTLSSTDFRGQSYLLALSIQDESAAKIVVKTAQTDVTYDTASDTVEGLTVGVDSVTYAGGTASPELYIYVVDTAGNHTALPVISFPAADNVPPTGELKYVEDIAETRVYLIPGEENVTVFGTTNLILDDENGLYPGCYYYSFTANGSYTFRFADAAGNTATLLAEVGNIDNKKMELVEAQYINGGVTYTAEQIEQLERIKGNIIAVYTFSKNIALVDGVENLAENYPPTYRVQANRLTVTFTPDYDPASYDPETHIIDVYADNADCVSVSVPNIQGYDVEPPAILSAAVYVNGVAVPDAVHGTDVDVTIAEGDQVEIRYVANQYTTVVDFAQSVTSSADQNQEFSLKTAAACDYTIYCYDELGNRSENAATVKVTVIPALSVEFAADANGTNATEFPNTLGLTAKQTIYVKTNKDATITCDAGDSVSAAAGVWTPITIPETQELCFLTITSGSETCSFYLTYTPADVTPPTITPKQDHVVLPVTVTEAELKEILLKGVVVRDDLVDAASITVMLDISDVKLGVAGTYVVRYTASDGVNTTKDEDAVTQEVILTENVVQLAIDGTPVAAFDTVLLDQGATHTLTIDSETPVYVAIKAGYKTEAQMKTGATVLARNEIVSQLELKDLTSGIHTLYVRTQDRETFLIYLSVS